LDLINVIANAANLHLRYTGNHFRRTQGNQQVIWTGIAVEVDVRTIDVRRCKKWQQQKPNELKTLSHYRSPDALPPYLLQPLAEIDSNPLAGDRDEKSQTHIAPELLGRTLPLHKDMADCRRRRQREIGKVSGGKKAVARKWRHEKRDKRPLH